MRVFLLLFLAHFVVILLAGRSPDPFSVLGMTKHNSDQEIKQAFRAKALKIHPDKGPREERESREAEFKTLQSSYEKIKDAGARHRFQLSITQQQQQQQQNPLFFTGSIFSQFHPHQSYNNNFAFQFHPHPSTNARTPFKQRSHIRKHLKVSLTDLFNGCEKVVFVEPTLLSRYSSALRGGSLSEISLDGLLKLFPIFPAIFLNALKSKKSIFSSAKFPLLNAGIALAAFVHNYLPQLPTAGRKIKVILSKNTNVGDEIFFRGDDNSQIDVTIVVDEPSPSSSMKRENNDIIIYKKVGRRQLLRGKTTSECFLLLLIMSQPLLSISYTHRHLARLTVKTICGNKKVVKIPSSSSTKLTTTLPGLGWWLPKGSRERGKLTVVFIRT